MKKILLITITAILALVSCNKIGKSEKPLPVVNANDPSITISDPTDTGFKATISAAEGTGFYSYTVLEGTAKAVSAENLLKVKLKGIKEATVNYKDNASTIIELAELKRNTDYTVYAVAASEQGTIGNVVTKTLRTSDTENPSFKSFKREENKITLTLSEPVELVEGVKFNAKYYAYLTESFQTEGKEEGTVDVSVEVKGADVEFSVDVPAGAYYSIDVPIGAFKDVLGNLTEKSLESSVTWDAEKKAVTTKNLANKVSNKSFELTLKDKDLEKIVQVYDVINVVVPEDVTIVSTDAKVTGEISYENDNEQHSYKTSSTLGDFVWDKELNLLKLTPNVVASTQRPDPIRGDDVTIKIPEDYLIDKYGNKNAALVIGPITYTYGYKVEDIIGTYPIDGKSAYGTAYDEEPFDMVISKSDDLKKGNVMISEFYGFKEVNIYGKFDTDLGVVEFPISLEPLGGLIQENYFKNFQILGYYSVIKGNGNNWILSVPKAGKLQSTNDYIGYQYLVYALPESGKVEDIDPEAEDLGGDYNCFAQIEFVRQDTTPEEPEVPVEPEKPEDGDTETTSVSMKSFAPIKMEAKKTFSPLAL